MYHPHLADLVTFQYLAFPVTVGLPPTPLVIIFPWGITQPTGRWTDNFTLVEIGATEEANNKKPIIKINY